MFFIKPFTMLAFFKNYFIRIAELYDVCIICFNIRNYFCNIFSLCTYPLENTFCLFVTNGTKSMDQSILSRLEYNASSYFVILTASI